MIGFEEAKITLIVLHLIGTALGAGGIYIAAVLFFRSLWKRYLSKADFEIFQVVSLTVLGGLIILLLSGIGLFALDPQKYIESSKFLTKMFVLLAIAANGILLHTHLVPILKRNTETDVTDAPEFLEKKTLFLIAGTISITSWTAAILLGSLRGIPYTTTEGILLYLGALGISIIGALLLKDYLIPRP